MMSVTQGWIHSCINQVSSQLLSGQMPSNAPLMFMLCVQHTNYLSRPCQSFVERSFSDHIETESVSSHDQ